MKKSLKFLKLMGVAGLMTGMLMAVGCGGSSDDTIPLEQVNVTGTGNADAYPANTTYTLAAGEYTYTIAHFAAGDKIVFPAGTPVSVDNGNFSDGKVVLSVMTVTGQVKAELTGLTAAQDAGIINVDNVKALFGADSVQQN